MESSLIDVRLYAPLTNILWGIFNTAPNVIMRDICLKKLIYVPVLIWSQSPKPQTSDRRKSIALF